MAKKILIIDDDVDILVSLKYSLTREGFEVETASNKEDGLQLLRTISPDLLIQDIMMDTELEGYGIVHLLKKEPEFEHLPVIMLTGMADAIGVNFRSAIEDNKLLKNVEFMDKGEELNMLVEKIKSMLT